ncbi:MAG: ABC transporter substrate-binding protein, partial [Chromatiales bacterium]|nr:ABC transporter substrate-binding protein [Chromatiales bacterium]
LIETAGDLARDVYFATHVSLDNPDPTVQDFVGAYTATYGHAPENAFAALGYDAMMLVADAIRRAGSTDATALREALAATQDLDAVTGDIGYERGSRVPRKDVTVMRVQDGRMGFVKTISP